MVAPAAIAAGSATVLSGQLIGAYVGAGVLTNLASSALDAVRDRWPGFRRLFGKSLTTHNSHLQTALARALHDIARGERLYDAFRASLTGHPTGFGTPGVNWLAIETFCNRLQKSLSDAGDEKALARFLGAVAVENTTIKALLESRATDEAAWTRLTTALSTAGGATLHSLFSDWFYPWLRQRLDEAFWDQVKETPAAWHAYERLVFVEFRQSFLLQGETLDALTSEVRALHAALAARPVATEAPAAVDTEAAGIISRAIETSRQTLTAALSPVADDLKRAIADEAIAVVQLTVDAVNQHTTATVGAAKEEILDALGHRAPPTHWTIPAPPAGFTGRSAEIETLLCVLQSGEGSGARVTGAVRGVRGQGGIGKTALTLEVAQRARARGLFPGGGLYIDLRGADGLGRGALTPSAALESLARQALGTTGLDQRLPEDTDALAAVLRGLLGADPARPWLVLLDNAASAAQARPLLAALPAGCRALLTSRQHFYLQGVLDQDLDVLPEDEATAFLMESTRDSARPLTGDLARRAARALGGLPLALEVFAGIVKGRSLTAPAALLADLEAKKLPLTEVTAHVFDLSLRQLDPALAEKWEQLSVCPTSFDAGAAAAVWDLPDAGLALAPLHSLIDASLLQATLTGGGETGEAPRFRLHDLARDHAARLLLHHQPPADASSPSNPPTLQGSNLLLSRLAQHYLERVRRMNHPLRTDGSPLADQLAAIAHYDREAESLQAVWSALASAVPLPSTASKALTPLILYPSLLSAFPDAGTYVFLLRQHPRTRVQWLERAYQAAQALGERPAQGAHLGNLGLAHAALGDARRALECHEQAMVISQETGDRRAEGAAWGNMGLAHAALGDARRALECREQCLEVLREFGNRRGEGAAWGNMGLAHADLGDARRALECYEQHLEIAQEIGDRRGEGNAWGNMGNAHAALGDARRALECYEQQLEIAREIGDRRGEANALFNSALRLWELAEGEAGDAAAAGRRAEARDRMARARELYAAMESPWAEMAEAEMAKWRKIEG